MSRQTPIPELERKPHEWDLYGEQKPRVVSVTVVGTIVYEKVTHTDFTLVYYMAYFSAV